MTHHLGFLDWTWTHEMTHSTAVKTRPSCCLLWRSLEVRRALPSCMGSSLEIRGGRTGVSDAGRGGVGHLKSSVAGFLVVDLCCISRCRWSWLWRFSVRTTSTMSASMSDGKSSGTRISWITRFKPFRKTSYSAASFHPLSAARVRKRIA